MNPSGNPRRKTKSRGRDTVMVGVDTGGTFTDIVYRDGDRAGVFKLPSTPTNPARAVIDGLERIFGRRPLALLTYGTTVATNAMLERRGAATALVTTSGFEDVLEIGRQARPDLYALEPRKPEPLVPRRRRFGVSERTLFDGTVERRPGKRELAELLERVRASGVRSVAICLLHSATEASNEKVVARALKKLGVPISVSHEISPATGEFERTSTVVVNAYVRPVMERHIDELASAIRARRFRVMQSNGGAIGAAVAAREPVRTMLSGPAGGVAAASLCAREAGIARAISFDMGGTSTDVALIDRGLPRRATSRIGGAPVRSPCLDIHTVGAGGGSIAGVDAGGSLKVGPRSAGADPGPACYGKGREPTVTDANVVLGRLLPDRFLGGQMTLSSERARRALEGLARSMRVGRAERAAAGVVEVVEANMERAVRLITVERGEDPRDCTLIAFGGAAALHACGLAEKLGLGAVLVPPDPGLLSARGVLDGPVIRDAALALRMVDPSHSELERRARPLVAQARGEIEAEGIARGDIVTEIFAKLRYLGQSIEIEVPLDRGLRSAFERRHRKLFRQAAMGRPIECSGLRVTATGSVSRPATAAHPSARPAASFAEGRQHDVSVLERDGLAAGFELKGPAIVVEYSATVWVAPGWRLWVDRHRNLRLER